MRTIIDLPDAQVRALETLCKQKQISRAEAIRQAVDVLLAEKRTAVADEAFGIWKHKKLDAQKHIAKLRAEWEK